MKKPLYLFIFLLLCLFSGLQAQTSAEKHNVIASAGNGFVAGDVQLNWTLGEVAIEAVKGYDNLITQGFHQGEYKMKNAISGSTAVEVSIFPNPSFDHIMIDTKQLDQEIFVQLFDIGGQLIISDKITENSVLHRLDLQELKANTYILQLSSANEDFQSAYKIIKSN